MAIKVYDQNGKEVGEMELPPEVFNVKMNSDLLHQVVVAQQANRRQVIAHTKDRGEVRGGGRKPWPQKGTGRARHGSIRSPIWIGGGVVFGPRKERNFKQKINKKMRRKALLMALSAKAKAKELILLDDLKLDQPKTKLMAQVFNNLPVGESSCLLVLPKYDLTLIRASRNLPNVQPMQAKDLNALDVLSYKYLVMPKEAIEVIKNTFVKSST